MSERANRPCGVHGCPEWAVKRGYCAQHVKSDYKRRRTERDLTYSEPWWLKWREQLRDEMAQLGLVPQCGTVHPSFRGVNKSLCREQGLSTFASGNGHDLAFHHEPPLRREEYVTPEGWIKREVVCDPARIVLLCSACHDLIPRVRL